MGYIKENHGNVFRKVAFSSMIESYIKLNQEIQVKNLKLKEIDDKLSELDKLKISFMNFHSFPMSRPNLANFEINGISIEEEDIKSKYAKKKLSVLQKKLQGKIVLKL